MAEIDEDESNVQGRTHRNSLFNFSIHSQSTKYKSLSDIDTKEKEIELLNEQGRAATDEENLNFFKVHNLCGEDIFEESDYDYCIVSNSAETVYRGNMNFLIFFQCGNICIELYMILLFICM